MNVFHRCRPPMVGATVLFLILAALPSLSAESPVVPRADTRIAILCYHAVPEVAPEKSDGYSVPFPTFKAQIQVFIDNGWTFVTLAQIKDFYAGKIQLPAKCIHISFDDGNITALTVTHPWLKARGIPHSIFPYISMIRSGKKIAMTWDDVKTMVADGVEVGCHTWYHPILTRPDKAVKDNPKAYAAWLTKETAGAKEMLEKTLGIKVDILAFPFGMADTQVLEALKTAGFQMALNILGGTNSVDTAPFGMCRILVTPQTTPGALLAAASARPLPGRVVSPAPFDSFAPGPVTFRVEIDPDKVADYTDMTLSTVIGPLGHGKIGDFRSLGKGVYELTADLDKPGWYMFRITGTDTQGGKAVFMMLGDRPKPDGQ